MTTATTETEEALQAALDADPGSGTLRRLLADHLEDVGDERFEGYRAAGLLGVWPYFNDHFADKQPWQWGEDGIVIKKYSACAHAVLPRAWCRLIDGDPQVPHFATFDTRREADDAAAVAFARLPAAVRVALLEGTA